MQYPALQKADWHIGSSMVESGNKLVMQARLKGAGMHWKPKQVNPMLALRSMNLCNERWQEGWSDSLRWNEQMRSATRRRKQQHRFKQRQTRQPQQSSAVVAVVQHHQRLPQDEHKDNIAGNANLFPLASFVKGALQKNKLHTRDKSRRTNISSIWYAS